MKNKFAGQIVAVAFTLFASSLSLAAQSVAAGSVVKLSTAPYGTLAGVFQGNVISGPGYGAPGSFLTFCLEKYEYFSPSNNLYVKSVTNATHNSTAGTSGAYYANDAILHPETGHTATSDPISKATEWIFTQFYANQSTYAGTDAKANSTQMAIWFLEGELNSTTDMTSYNNNVLAKTFVANATAAVTTGGWTDVGDRVRVLNLYSNYSVSGGYSGHAQDQLYMVPVPEPETYAMMLAGLGLIGFVAGRRRRTLL